MYFYMHYVLYEMLFIITVIACNISRRNISFLSSVFKNLVLYMSYCRTEGTNHLMFDITRMLLYCILHIKIIIFCYIESV